MAVLDSLNEEGLAKLPRWGKVFLAARCARRAIQMLDAKQLPSGFSQVLETLDRVDRAAANATTIEVSRDISPAREFADSIQFLGGRKSPEQYAALAVDDAFGLASTVGIKGRGPDDAEAYQRKKLSYAIGSVYASARLSSREKQLGEAIASDINAILGAPRGVAEIETEMPFSQDFLAIRSSFDISAQVAGHSIIDLTSAINDEIIARLSENPEKLYELEPRSFEELIARIFEGYGLSVELTAPVRDGGRDIIAVAHQPAKLKFLIECKRYARHNKVGIALVQRLHGVVQGEEATVGLLATTSSFTDPALEFLGRPNVKYRLDGRDFEGVRQWLMAYDRLRMARQILGSEFTMTPAGLIVMA